MDPIRIDALQYANWSRAIFTQWRAARLGAVHATVAYHLSFRAVLDEIVAWNWRFSDHADLIAPLRAPGDIDRAAAAGRTAVLLGLQNPLAIEDDLGLLKPLHDLGIRVMQLTYNNQSLLGCGWGEAQDAGVTRMGREAISEMNRLGLLIDLSHAGERTALDAIALSTRPVAVTHATPAEWRPGGRQVSRRLMQALAEAEGMLGLSLYPLHLADGSATTLAAFCDMAARAAEVMGVGRLGIGSDLCQDRPDEVVQWMREGRWQRADKAAPRLRLPPRPDWFQDSRGFDALAGGLRAVGFSDDECGMILGANWHRFLRAALRPAP